jgi:hypothetical protein
MSIVNTKRSRLRKRSGDSPITSVVRKRVASLHPSPENSRLYRQPESDPEHEKLVESIRKNGLLEDLVITADNYIVAGHRRHAALVQIGQQFVRCRVLPIRRGSMSENEYVANAAKITQPF